MDYKSNLPKLVPTHVKFMMSTNILLYSDMSDTIRNTNFTGKGFQEHTHTLLMVKSIKLNNHNDKLI